MPPGCANSGPGSARARSWPTGSPSSSVARASLPAPSRSRFSACETSTGLEVEVFVRKEDAFEIAALGRRRSLDLPDVPGEPLVLYTPEDVILLELHWYRLGNGSADQQWSDVLGVLKVQAERLDFAWLDHWAQYLGVDDLLQRVRQEASV
jgi:hypothetical protein